MTHVPGYWSRWFRFLFPWESQSPLARLLFAIVSAIFAGLLFPFLGGSYVTISGPAAGLAPALFAGMISLATAQVGSGKAAGMTTQEILSKGYPLVLVAIAIAGVLQVVLSRFKIARLSAMLPAAAIEGMLSAIGLIIVVKQLPLTLGVEFESHEFWQILREAPRQLKMLIYQPSHCICLYRRSVRA